MINLKIIDLFKRRKEFVDQLSNNGEYLNLGDKKEIVTAKDIEDGEIYYRIGDKEHRIPLFLDYIQDKEAEGIVIPLEKRTNGKYLIIDDEITPEDRYDMLRHMLKRNLMYLVVLINETIQDEPNEELKKRKDSLCSTADIILYVAKQLYSENRIEEANEELTKKIEEVLTLNEQLLENDKDIQI